MHLKPRPASSIRKLPQLVVGFVLSFFAACLPVRAETIGLSIPLSGDAAELGKMFRIGAKLAMENYGQRHKLFIADDGCDADLALLAAEDMKRQQAAIVTGLICNEPAKVIATKFSDTSIPVVVAGAQSVRLIKDREREAWNLWRMSPGDDYPVEVAARAISRLWQNQPYAIVDDGTIYGRNFTDALRAKLDEIGLRPQFSDTFRAAQSTQAGLLRRLQRSGVTAAFIASATVEDLLTITTNMKEFDIELDLITSEALSVLPLMEEAGEVPEGVKVILAPQPQHVELQKILQEQELLSDNQIYNGYAAIQLAIQILDMRANKTNAQLAEQTYETVLGQIRFNSNGSSNHNPYELRVWDGEVLQPVENGTEKQ